MGEARENDAYEEELRDYEEDEEKAPDAVAAKGSNETAKKIQTGVIAMKTIKRCSEVKGEIVVSNKAISGNLEDEEIVVFVLGGPGSGKGTQCSRIATHFGFCHLSAGDLLQFEAESGSENGTMIQNFKKEGKLVPPEVVVRLLQRSMQASKTKKFLIDGFPRSKENLDAAENIMKIEPDFVLFFDCSKEEMTRRLLNRNQGRVDDNLETILKRLDVYFESTLPVLNYYSCKRKVLKIDAQRTVEQVFEDVKGIFSKFKIGN